MPCEQGSIFALVNAFLEGESIECKAFLPPGQGARNQLEEPDEKAQGAI
ncbi:MAG TPA: hypothetical protein VFV38_30700 [Ktedonobacteraceae bacterium]|nr:hypothetical protein [Ktedonobacteraceae bacterium]